MTVTVASVMIAFLGSVILPVRDALVDCAQRAAEIDNTNTIVGNAPRKLIMPLLCARSGARRSGEKDSKVALANPGTEENRGP